MSENGVSDPMILAQAPEKRELPLWEMGRMREEQF